MNVALESALSGLRAAEAGMAVVAHNVANVGTEGYTRQRVVLTARSNATNSAALLNGGVNVEGVQRISDRWLSSHLRSQQSSLSYYSTLGQRLGEVETVFNESADTGIADALNQFFSALGQVAAAPETKSVRITTVGAAELLTSRLRGARDQLSAMARDNNLEIAGQVEHANELLAQIGKLNEQVAAGVYNGYNVSALQDSRDKLITEVTSLLGGQAAVSQDEALVSISVGGATLVVGNNYATLAAGANGVLLAGTTTELDVSGGDLGALVDVHSDVLPRYQAQLDQLAGTLITSFNAQHQLGYGLNGTTGDDLLSGTDASDIGVNPALVTDPDRLAASADGAPGNAANLAALHDLRDQPLLGTQTIDEYYESMVGGIGTETSAAKAQSGSFGNLVNSLQSQVDSVQGVSLDEEMTNLIRFQQAYSAAARLISVADQMLQTLMQIGR